MIPIDMEITGNSTPAFQTGAQFDLVAPIYPALERLVFGVRLDDVQQAFFKETLRRTRSC
jgi:hypothetical protein